MASIREKKTIEEDSLEEYALGWDTFLGAFYHIGKFFPI